MKYLKKYEYLNNYKIDNYVKIKYSSHTFKIINIDHKWNYPYKLEYYADGLLFMNCKNEDIERYATPSEIEKFELKKSINKYNL